MPIIIALGMHRPFLHTLQTWFEEMGYPITITSHVEEAQVFLQRSPLPLILLLEATSPSPIQNFISLFGPETDLQGHSLFLTNAQDLLAYQEGFGNQAPRVFVTNILARHPSSLNLL